MAHENRYYIIDSNDTNMQEIMNVCAGELETQRFNLAKTKLVVKLCCGDENDYLFLSKYQEYDHKQILLALDNDEWIEQNFNP